MSIKHQLEVQGVIEALQRAVSTLKKYESQPNPTADSTEWAKALVQVIYNDPQVGGVIFGLIEELERALPANPTPIFEFSLDQGDMK